MNNLEEIKRLVACVKPKSNKALIECPNEVVMGHSLVCFLEKSLKCQGVCIQFNFKEKCPRFCFWIVMNQTKTFMEIEINETEGNEISLSLVKKGDSVSVDFTTKVFNALIKFLSLKADHLKEHCNEIC